MRIGLTATTVMGEAGLLCSFSRKWAKLVWPREEEQDRKCRLFFRLSCLPFVTCVRSYLWCCREDEDPF